MINKMSKIIGKPQLFRDCYSKDRPKEFGFLLRPTQSEFNTFVLLLDKMMSDNINKNFFKGDITLEAEEERFDGKIIVHKKGTIQLLESWINRYFRTPDRSPIDEMISTFKMVRKLRQKPAHKVSPDRFDQDIFKKQREVVISAHGAVRTLRLILANHPRVIANPVEIPDWLFNGEIWDI